MLSGTLAPNTHAVDHNETRVIGAAKGRIHRGMVVSRAISTCEPNRFTRMSGEEGVSNIVGEQRAESS